MLCMGLLAKVTWKRSGVRHVAAHPLGAESLLFCVSKL